MILYFKNKCKESGLFGEKSMLPTSWLLLCMIRGCPSLIHLTDICCTSTLQSTAQKVPWLARCLSPLSSGNLHVWMETRNPVSAPRACDKSARKRWGWSSWGHSEVQDVLMLERRWEGQSDLDRSGLLGSWTCLPVQQGC